MKKIIIIGKRNVGKSSLFNLLTSSVDAISLDYLGYTRDCNHKRTKILSCFYEIIDTPGIGYFSDDLDILAVKKIWHVINSSNIVLFLISIDDIIDRLFFNIVNMLSNNVQSVIYILNKIDIITENDLELFLIKFCKFNPLLVSIKQKIGIYELLQRIDNSNKIESTVATKKKRIFKIGIIGKQNVGKSLLANRFLNENKSIVYDYPGTTRDSLETYLIKNNNSYLVIDTPGIKKKNKIVNQIDKMPSDKVFFSIRTSDMCIIVVDAIDVFNKQNSIIIRNAFNLCKFNLIVINKSDKMAKKDLICINEKLIKSFSFLMNVNYQFISARYLFNFNTLFNRIERLRIVQKNLLLLDILASVKDIINLKFTSLDKTFVIKRLYVKNFSTYTINVVLKEKVASDNYKRYLCALIIKYINLRIFSFKFKFK
ncbi:MAG TPA: GTPase [Candidatus Azoamicus sp. OHIO2]